MNDEPETFEELKPELETVVQKIEAVAEHPTIPAPLQISPGAWSAATSTWISMYVRNSPIAQSVEAWTHLGVVLPQLSILLNAELAKQQNP